MSNDWYVQRAIELYGKKREGLDGPGMEPGAGLPDPGTGPDKPGLYRDEKPMVSKGTNPGAWVMMWAWVPDPPEVNSGQQEGGPQAAGGETAARGDHGADG